MRRLWALVVFGSMSLSACDEPSDALHDATAGALAGDLDSSVGAADPGSDAGESALDASATVSTDADEPRNDARAAPSDAAPDGAARPDAALRAPNLRIYSDTSSIEFTPALYAAQKLYPGTASVSTGGIANLFSAGQADLATNAETQALRQSAQHPNLRIIFSVTETFYRIVARRSSGIAQLADLRGKRVGTVQNTSAHYYLDKMLRTVGLSATDVTVVAAFPLTRMPSMLRDKQVDAVTSWEPEPQNAADAIGSDAIEFQDRSVYREMVNLHTTSEQLANPEKRRAMVAFVRALIEAADAFQNRPDDVLPLVSEATGYDVALLRKVWHLERFPGTLLDDLLDVLEQEEPWVASQTGRAPRTRAQLAELIDDSVLQEALATR